MSAPASRGCRRQGASRISMRAAPGPTHIRAISAGCVEGAKGPRQQGHTQQRAPKEPRALSPQGLKACEPTAGVEVSVRPRIARISLARVAKHKQGQGPCIRPYGYVFAS